MLIAGLEGCFDDLATAVETFRSAGAIARPPVLGRVDFVANTGGQGRIGLDAAGVLDQAVGVLIARGAENPAEGRRLLIRAADRSGVSLQDAAKEVLDQAGQSRLSAGLLRAAVYLELDEALSGDAGPGLVRQISELAVARVGGAVAASVTMLHDVRYETESATSPLAEQIDRLQCDERQGPCVTVLQTGVAGCFALDLATEDRWPVFASKAADIGVDAVMSFRLGLRHDEVARASLNVYATGRWPFDGEAVATGLLLAAQAGRALTSTFWQSRAHYLEQALDSNRRIGAAMGILMAQRLVTETAAFDLLRAASQRTSRKLRDVAADVVATGELDD